MPFRVAQEWLDSIIYLYPDESSALAGDEVGGTGFLLGWPINETGNFTLWAVTNRHVIEQGNWTLRLNGRPEGLVCLDTTEQEWIYADGSDLAVRPVALSQALHRFSYITTEWLLPKASYEALDIGPGDPCVSVGRFIGHAGKRSNNPVVRFGQISQNSSEPVEIGGLKQECILVESRSIGGFSGSPVYVHLDGSHYRPNMSGVVEGQRLYRGVFPQGPWLLGINFAMVPLWESVRDKTGQEMQGGQRVPINTGLMAIVPGWHLIELLETGPASTRRKAIEMAIAIEEASNRGLPAVIPSAVSGHEQS